MTAWRRSRLEDQPLRAYVPVMFFAKVDAWVGKTLFVPPIIKLCQVTRQTQFAVSRLFWFMAALDGFYRAETMLSSVIWGGLSVVMMITATKRADDPTGSYMFFRMLGLCLLIVDVVAGAVTGDWAGAEFWVIVLAAEYASTIRTVPPGDLTRKGKVEASIGS